MRLSTPLSPKFLSGAVSGSGRISAVDGSYHLKVFGLQHAMMFAAYGNEVVHIGSSVVAVPFLDVMQFASVHRRPALEASAIPNSYC